jgi:3-dehydroquinate synthase
MKTLTVELGERSYPIYINNDLLDRADLLKPYILGKQVLIVTNETIAPLYLDRVKAAVAGFDLECIILPDGEQYKTLDITTRIFDLLLQKHFNRTATLIALGGGVIGDITGFAAACYQRGIHFIQIPTTLLAQVDSSVGGKTGVNHPLGKNMIGAFYQPRCVIADTSTLNTLDDRQLSAGIAEVIKYGLIRDPEFFDWLENNIEKLLSRDSDALALAVERSCQNKAEVVAADEKEGGQRALLNLGHTFGHAIETGTGYGTWLHGEGVASGMLMAADLSHRLGWLTSKDLDRIKELLIKSRLPVQAPAEISTERFIELMSVDKKVLAGKLRLVLLKGIGQSLVTEDFEHQHLLNLLDEFPRIDSKSLAL